MAMEFNEIAEVVEADPMRRRRGLEGDDPSFSLSEFDKKTEDYITDEEISKLQQIDGEKRDEHGYTDLHYASGHGDVKKIEDLLANGANIEARSNIGMTPLMCVAFDSKGEGFQTLLDKGADINARTNNGKTALILVSQTGKNSEVIDDLIDAGADINATDIDGCTPLMWASARGHTDIVKLLIEKGADIDIKTHRGNTASDLAKNKEIRDLLTQAKEEQAKNKEMAQNSGVENMEEGENPMEDFSSEISEIESKLDAVEETDELVDNGPPEQLEEEMSAETKIPSELNQTIPVEKIEKSETFEINPLLYRESFVPHKEKETSSEKSREQTISKEDIFRTATIFNPYQKQEEAQKDSKSEQEKVSVPKRPRNRADFFKQMEEHQKRFEEERNRLREEFGKQVAESHKRFEEETKKMEEDFGKGAEEIRSRSENSSLKDLLANAQQKSSDISSSTQQSSEDKNNDINVGVPAILKEHETGMKDYGVPTAPPEILTGKGDYSLTGKNQDINIMISSAILKNKGRA